ncbi:MAG: DUF2905 domain-containing protein [Candidatus Bipolaricaulota bacterium]|nr:DUF2905 domain-containing protein [Candidatus Bipolaricaulota bacterium]
MQVLGKLLMIVGGMLLVLGVVLYLSKSIPWLGRLPGDIVIERPNVTIYIPVATSLLLSLVLSAFFYLLSRLR